MLGLRDILVESPMTNISISIFLIYFSIEYLTFYIHNQNINDIKKKKKKSQKVSQ